MKNKEFDVLSRLPAHFDVGWAKFSFKLVDKLTCPLGNTLYGQVDFDTATIQIDASLKGHLALDTVIHEAMHCLLETVGLGAPEETEELTTTNELLTEATTRCMLMFRNLNPKLWELLFETYYE